MSHFMSDIWFFFKNANGGFPETKSIKNCHMDVHNQTRTSESPTVTMTEWIEDYYPSTIDVRPHESLEDYQSGGFHPVALGDTFQDGRYVVRHKLGFGGRATVWLVQDIQQEYVLPL